MGGRRGASCFLLPALRYHPPFRLIFLHAAWNATPVALADPVSSFVILPYSFFIINSPLHFAVHLVPSFAVFWSGLFRSHFYFSCSDLLCLYIPWTKRRLHWINCVFLSSCNVLRVVLLFSYTAYCMHGTVWWQLPCGSYHTARFCIVIVVS